MKRRVIFVAVIALACAAAAISMYVVRLDANALRLHAGRLGASVSFTGIRPSLSGVVFLDAILRRQGTFDVYFVAPELRAARRGDTWSIRAADNFVHAFGPAFSMPSGFVHHAEFTFEKGRVDFDSEIRAPFFMVDTPKVYDRPLTWDNLVFTFSGRVDEATSVLTLDRGSVRKGDATINVAGNWRVGFSARPATLEFGSRALNGDQVRELLPEALTTRLGDVRFGGQLGFGLRMYASESPTGPVRVDVEIDNRLSVSGLSEGCNLAPLASSFSWDEYDIAGGSISHDTGPGSADWCPLDTLPPAFTNAVIALIDPLFPIHRGISPYVVSSLLEGAINRTQAVRATATITERFAATLWPLPGKGLRRRVEMAVLAVHLEQSLDKPAILALYANTADFGHGIRGIREAARRLFDKSPGELTACESVLLALTLDDPSAALIDQDGHALPSAVPAARAQLDELHTRGIVTDAQHQAALEELK
jgi:hypothetical protein